MGQITKNNVFSELLARPCRPRFLELNIFFFFNQKCERFESIFALSANDINTVPQLRRPQKPQMFSWLYCVSSVCKHTEKVYILPGHLNIFHRSFICKGEGTFSLFTFRMGQYLHQYLVKGKISSSHIWLIQSWLFSHQHSSKLSLRLLLNEIGQSYWGHIGVINISINLQVSLLHQFAFQRFRLVRIILL